VTVRAAAASRSGAAASIDIGSRLIGVLLVEVRGP
jgi:hypothetical protein